MNPSGVPALGCVVGTRATAQIGDGVRRYSLNGVDMQHPALIYKAHCGVEARPVVTGHPRPGQILIGIDFAGVCGTDLDILRGARPETPQILGHEGIGRILKSCVATPEYSVGSFVIFNPVSAFDQRDILGHTFQGIWQARRLMTADELQRGHAVPFEPRISAVIGTLVEPLGTVLYGLSLMRQCVELNSIGIVGSGMIGLLFAIEARRQGVRQVILLGPSRTRLDWAIAQGIVSANEAVLVERHTGQVLDRSQLDDTFDGVVVCTPRCAAASGVSIGADIVRPRGVMDLVGGVADGDRNATLPAVNLNGVRRANIRGVPAPGVCEPAVTARGKHLHLTGHRGTSSEHLLRAATILAAEDSCHARIITHVLPIRRAPEVFARLLPGRERQLVGQHVVKLILELNDYLEAELSTTGITDFRRGVYRNWSTDPNDVRQSQFSNVGNR